MQLQKRSLTSLKLDFCTEPPFGIEMIHNFVIQNMTNLKHVKLGYSHLPLINCKFTCKDLTPDMCVAKNIESMDFITPCDLNDSKIFFEMLPNLKRLTIEPVLKTLDENIVQLLLHISTLNIKLETLKVTWINYEL